jgi:ankyrin repeat protein
VVFQTDYICQQTNAKEMMEAAKSMPPDAKSIYSRTMDQINCQSSNQANQANRILIWLTFACRNLTPQELVEALAVEDNTGSLDPLNKSSPTTLARICRGLVIVDEKNNIVQLAHRTVQDFLLDLHEKNRPNIQNEMCSICLTYLSFDVFRGGPSPTTEEFFRRDDNHFFLHYACWHLEDHFLWAAPDEALLERMYELITCKPLVESYLQARSSSIHRGFIIQFSGFQNFRGQYTAEPTALHVATMIGRSLLVDLVLTRLPHLLNQTDGIGRTALALAVTLGSEDIVRSLLDAGADTSIVSGETLLNCAARNRYDAIVDLLLHHQPLTSLWEFPSEKDERAQQLLGAFIKGDEKLARRLLELGVDVDARDVDGGTALQWAAWYGYSGIVAILLDYGADVDAADHTSGRRALHEAAKHGHLETLKLLLVRGAKVDARDRLSWTPLHHAATQGGWRVVEVLLQHGADVNAKTSDRKGPLDLACQNSQLATIPLLLQHGADIKSEDYDIEDIKIWATKGRLELDGKDIIVLAPLDGV